jgi:pimeloyl-ACP methyl ester carboxylesterase
LRLFIVLLCVLVVCGLALSFWRSRSIAAEVGRQYPPIGTWISVDGVRMHVVDRGPKAASPARTLVLIHGASGNLREMLLAFDGYEQNSYRLIAIDRPGHGWSEEGDPAHAATLKRQADLVAGVLDGIGIRKAVIVGHSFGGAVALRVAIEHPGKTAGLLLLSPVSHPWPGGIAWYYHIATMPVIGPLFSATLAPVAGKAQLAGGAASVFAPAPLPADYLDRSGIALVLRPSQFAANARQMATLFDEIIAQKERYGGISTPVEVLSADKDTVVSPEIHARALTRDIPGAALAILEGAGHVPHHTRKPETLEALQRLETRIPATDR